jgi:hypothetical protein
MTKVLGCKVSDETYYKIASLGPIISDTMRDAINYYLEHNQKIKVNQVNHSKNKKSIKD